MARPGLPAQLSSAEVEGFDRPINRQRSVDRVRHASQQALRLTATIMWILFAAHAYSAACTTLGAHDFIQGLMSCIPGGQWGALGLKVFVLFILGMVLDLIWFGVIFIVMMAIGCMTPPFGFNLFYIKGVAPPSVAMGENYTSVVPCVLVTLLGVPIIILVPDIALFFPNLFFGKG